MTEKVPVAQAPVPSPTTTPDAALPLSYVAPASTTTAPATTNGCVTTPEKAAEHALKEARMFGFVDPNAPPKTSFAFEPVVLNGVRELARVVSTMNVALLDIEDCYQAAKKKGLRSRGTVTIRLELDRCGDVVSASDQMRGQVDARFLECVTKTYRDLYFDAIDADNRDIVVRAHRFP